MLAIGRAMMSKPNFILFDELSLRVAPLVVDSVLDGLPRQPRARDRRDPVRAERCFALSAAGRAYVLTGGELALEGTAEEVRSSASLRETYLGTAA